MNGTSLGVGASFIAGLFFHIDAGAEQGVINKLREKGYTNLFKAFGQYDVAVFFDVSSFEDDLIYNSFEGVRTVKPLIAYKFVTSNYQSPDIAQWSRNAPIIGFIFLELDKWFYSQESGSGSSLSASLIIIEKLNKFADDLDVDIAIYGGYGKSEIYVAVKATRMEDIWNITLKCREMTNTSCFLTETPSEGLIPVFMKTRSIPCVSFDCIEYTEDSVDVSGIDGKTHATISISCPPSFENYIYPSFDAELFYCAAQLGEEDALIKTKIEIETSSLIGLVLNFRNNWAKNYKSYLSSRTQLQQSFIENTISPDAYEVTQINREPNIPSTLQANNIRLANRIKNFSHTINAYDNNRSFHAVSRSISNFSDYLDQELNNYNQFATENILDRMSQSESVLMEAIEAAEIGLAQRIDSNFDSISFPYEVPLPFGDGIFTSLVAIEDLINFIFELWSKHNSSYQGKSAANGFPTFNDSSGFKVGWGEVINLPLVALYDPTDSRGNWLTLTHEISHAIFIRLGIDKLKADELEAVRVKGLSDRKEFLHYDDVYEDQVFELFAHWYDYYHFYDEDLVNYLDHIWSSWSLIPIYHARFEDYFFRSFCIFMIHNEKKFISKRTKPKREEYKLLINDLWKEHLTIIKNQSHLATVEEIEKVRENKKLLLRLFTAYHEVFKIFFEFKNDDFRTSINDGYDDLELNIKDILSGTMVSSNIVNPYVLTKNVIFHKHDKKDVRCSTALIMSLKNRAFFYIKQNDE